MASIASPIISANPFESVVGSGPVDLSENPFEGASVVQKIFRMTLDKKQNAEREINKILQQGELAKATGRIINLLSDSTEAADFSSNESIKRDIEAIKRSGHVLNCIDDSYAFNPRNKQRDIDSLTRFKEDYDSLSPERNFKIQRFQSDSNQYWTFLVQLKQQYDEVSRAILSMGRR